MVTTTTPYRGILALLCKANDKIDEIARREHHHPEESHGSAPQNSIQHHVVALAGVIKKTKFHSMLLSHGGIIVEVRRAR